MVSVVGGGTSSVRSFSGGATAIWPSQVTPHFNSLEELEKFCAENRAEFDRLAELESGPEKFFWEK